MEWYGIVALYGMLFCGSVDYEKKHINGTACLGGLCARLIYCTADRVLVQRHTQL